MIHRQSIIFLVCTSASLAISNITMGNEPVSIATDTFTSNWNPISYHTYPAHVVTRLTTMRLFEKRCSGTELNKSTFSGLCQLDLPTIGTPDMELVLKDECGLDGDDIRYTVTQINKVRTNDYFVYGLGVDQVSGDEYVLKLTNFSSPDRWIKQNAFTFPIIKKTDEDDVFDRVFSPGTQEFYNQLTNGSSQVDEFGDNQVRLSAVHDTEKRVEIRYYDSRLELQQLMATQDTRPDVVLAMPGKNISSELYEQRETQDLNNFIYLGFNFNAESKRVKNLFESKVFRENVAQTLWSAEPINKKMNISQDNPRNAIGSWLGQSFSAYRAINIKSSADLKKHVKRIIKRREPMILRVLVSPFVRRLFEPTEFTNIQQHFKQIWNQGNNQKIEFQFVNPQGKREFTSIKDEGKFDLIFDIFFYRSSYFNYFSFLEPENEMNFLGVRIFTREQIASFIADKEAGDVQFLNRVEKEYPVAVVGSLHLRNLFSTRRTFDGSESTICKGDSQSMPFSGLYEYMGVYKPIGE